MKILITICLFFLSSACFAGSHGVFDLSCTSQTLRTHMFLKLNDYDFVDTPLYPQVIVISVMGHISIFDQNDNNRFDFKTEDKKSSLKIFSTDKEKSHIFNVDFKKSSSAEVVIVRADNPRTGKKIENLTLDCTKVHNL